MKQRFTCVLCLLLSLILLLAACDGGEKPNDGTNTGDTETAAVAATYSLSEFQIVRADNASVDLTAGVTKLNGAMREYLGKSMKIKTDLRAEDEIACEIVIGWAARTQTQELLNALSYGEYLIQTVSTENGMKILVGGRDDQTTLFAIDEFIKMLEQNQVEGGEGKVNTLNLKGQALDGLGQAQIAQMAILYDSSCGTLVTSAARSLWKAIARVGGKTVQLVALDSGTSIEKYPYALVIGAVDETAKSLTKETDERTHAVKTELSDNSYRAYMVGGSDIEILRAIQLFHTHAVINGELIVPKRLEMTVKSELIRDPCIVVHQNKYYVYENAGTGYGVRVSNDLLTWSDRTMVFDKSWYSGFTGTQSFWAPEVHYYNGAFYLFGTYYDGVTNLRGTAIFRSTTPTGRFEIWSNGFITPKDRHSIDGTLYVEDGVPYMVYVDEWPNYGDKLNHDPSTAKGRMAYVQLTPDLKSTVGEHHTDLFVASDPTWTNYGITDGAWMYRCQDGTLLMLWSNRDSSGNYCVGIAISSNGKITGEWTHQDKPLFTASGANVYCTTEGGHSMVFTALDGRMYLAIHTPNSGETTAMTLIPLVETDGMLFVDVVKA